MKLTAKDIAEWLAGDEPLHCLDCELGLDHEGFSDDEWLDLIDVDAEPAPGWVAPTMCWSCERAFDYAELEPDEGDIWVCHECMDRWIIEDLYGFIDYATAGWIG